MAYKRRVGSDYPDSQDVTNNELGINEAMEQGRALT